ncbi:hypothetical protein [Frigoriglobus tundricola]|uniref:Uncharacterized protein n=1 Tax=Frigoriglobus tundricola TaxID=2774151 RepID=A0A6M5Z4A4_9BACT|nr:hypothetical protein [Frigoriglobus tundricola]QJX01079.1 hypothetical protein FTUN_8718 [Frigoriglobus tundricola]
MLLPSDLYEALVKLAGTVYLWELFVEDMARFRRSKNIKTKEFAPTTVAHVIGNIFREYSEAHPDRPRLSPHALRRRGITLTVAATQSVDAASQAIGVTAATVKAAYLNAERAFHADAVFSKLAETLRLPSGAKDAQAKPGVSHQSPTNKRHKGERKRTSANNKNE